MAILFSILSGAPQTRTIIGKKLYKFICNCEKEEFTLNQPVSEIFQNKYLCQAFFYAKNYANETDNQKSSNMIDLCDFIGDNYIFAIKDRLVVFFQKKNKLEKDLERTPKKHDKEEIKKRLAPINKEFNHIHPAFLKNYEGAKSKFMISTEQTSNEDDIYWLTNNDMINLPLIASIGVLCDYDKTKDINQN